jgi:cellulose synthase operon protein C
MMFRVARSFGVAALSLCALAQTPPRRAAQPARPPAQSANPGITEATAEALWRAQDYKGAMAAFDALIAAHPENAELRLREGQLFLERYNPDEAKKLYQEAIEIDPKFARAYLALAELLAEDYNSKAAEAADKALELDPKMYQAHELKARMALEDDDYKKAIEEADSALAIDPNALQALAVRAAMDLLQDKESAWLTKIDGRARGFETIAHFFVINRRYEDGITYYRKAIASDPQLWSAHSQMAINLMRLGREDEARKELELAFNNHFTDSQTTNSLRLMDTYGDYKTFVTPTTILKLHKKEAEALHPYFEAEMLRAMAVYEKKYQFKLKTPIQVEVYPNHEDFAVRTMGMPGLGALGVTFNATIAMDSPSGRPPGQFHWASTLWHEMSHVYILTLTNYRVPRWFTEGVAVHEETATTPDWGDRITPDIIVALRDKKLLPIAEIDRGFVHPKFPAQVIVSYFEAGKMCDYIAERWGETKLLDMAHQFAKNRPTVDVIRDELKMEPEAFDKDFLAYLDKQTGFTVKNFETWTKGIGELNKLARNPAAIKAIAEHSGAVAPKDQTGKSVPIDVPAEGTVSPDDIIAKARALELLYPDYVEAGNPYLIAAKACLAKQDKACALEEYAKYSKQSGRDAEAIKKYSDLLKEAGKQTEAAAALERLNAVNPLDQDLHEKLGALYLATNKAPLAVREYSAVVALKPLDVAGSHYNLAMAYKAQGLEDKAREEALTALEAAPDYRPAQKLLLQLSGEGLKR